VRRQVEVGIDIVSDGEMSKISYATYIARRLAGFDGDTESDFLRERNGGLKGSAKHLG
jgi:methionine synthase II (cobalamin-independent)